MLMQSTRCPLSFKTDFCVNEREEKSKALDLDVNILERNRLRSSFPSLKISILRKLFEGLLRNNNNPCCFNAIVTRVTLKLLIMEVFTSLSRLAARAHSACGSFG